MEDIIYKNGMFAKAFPIEDEPNKKRVAQRTISNDIAEVFGITLSFNFTTVVF